MNTWGTTCWPSSRRTAILAITQIVIAGLDPAIQFPSGTAVPSQA
jgi:hypothetical protein